MTLGKPLNSSTKVAYLISFIEVFSSDQQHKKFELKFSNQRMRVDSLVIYFRKDFYLVKQINEKIDDLITSGIVFYWIRSYIERCFMKTRIERREPKQLNFHHFKGPFTIAVIGWFAAILSFLIELIRIRVNLKYCR